MSRAEEILDMNIPNKDWDRKYHEKYDAIVDSMEQYAREVAKASLERAVDRLDKLGLSLGIKAGKEIVNTDNIVLD